MAPGHGRNGHVEDRTLRDVLIIGAALVLITVLHLYTDVDLVGLQLLYRRLYYAPIIYAAWVFGVRGGVPIAFASGLLYLPTALMGSDLGRIEAVHEIAMYLLIGSLFGWLRDLEDARSRDLRLVRSRLEDAYSKLEERAVQLVGIQEYTSSILRAITAGVLTVGPDTSITTANPAAERLMRMGEEMLVPRPLGTLFKDDGGLTQLVQKVLDGRVPRILRETTLETRHGRVLHVQAAVSRMRAGGCCPGLGRPGAVVTLEDVSEVKSLTEQLIRADRLAALGELTAGIAHEVRNPLGIIRATMQMIEDPQTDPERMSEAAGIVKQEIDRLDKVIKAFLDFGRPSAPTMMRVDLEELLGDVVLLTRRFAGRAEVQLEEEYSGDLPVVLADPDQLKQVFVNLVSNAVQAMGEHGGIIRISTGLDDGFVVASVADDGPGMDAAQVAKVFDPFFSTKDEGTGLGLTIVHRIVDEHDGHIDVESQPGEGTQFRVHLPIREPLEHAERSGGVGGGRAADRKE
jgi:two-component system, sporulation sensor kinase E